MPWTRLRVVTEYVIKSRSKQTRATQRTRLLSGYVYKLASTKTAKNWFKGTRTLTKSQKAFAPFEMLQRHGQRRPLPPFTQGKGVSWSKVRIWREVSPKLAKRVVLTRINRWEVSQEQHQNKNLHADVNLHFPRGRQVSYLQGSGSVLQLDQDNSLSRLLSALF